MELLEMMTLEMYLADNGTDTPKWKSGYHRSCDINYHYTSNGKMVEMYQPSIQLQEL
jgi:hypothetical protein